MNKSNCTPLTDALLPRVRPMALEQRFMFDAAAASTATDPQHTLDTQHTDASAADSLAKFAIAATVSVPVEVRAVDPALNNGRKEVAFIDTGVADYQTLVDGIRAGVEIVLLDAGQDGLAQMALWAQSHSGYDAIHVLSHGADASIQLGKFHLSNANLDNNQVQSELVILGQSLAITGDLLIYGCEVSKDDLGLLFIDRLAQLTQVDVASSIDVTGDFSKGGNWQLETVHGSIETLSLNITDYSNLLVTNVTYTADAGQTATDASISGAGSQYTIDITDTASGNVLRLVSTGTPMYLDTAANLYIIPVGSGNIVQTDTNNLATSITLTVLGGKVFDFKSAIIREEWDVPTNLRFTPDGDIANSYDILFGRTETKTVDLIGDLAFSGISSLEITATTSSGAFLLAMDSIELNNIRVPASGPTVTDGKISISSSPSGSNTTYKIGDTVTASWNNTAIGDNQSGITGVTMDFSQFGGGTAVTASDSSGTWTASYTITAGSVDATTRNVSVTATSSSGSTTTADTSNLSVDNIAPTVTDARISISGGSGTGGAFNIGDTVTATWNNTGSGDKEVVAQI